MTAQIPDRFIYNEKAYSVASISGKGYPFRPDSYGMHPLPSCTASWRGYLCTYAIHDKRLVLSDLDINLRLEENEGQSVPQSGLAINNVLPVEKKGDHSIFNTHFEMVDLPLMYTGTILIADKFIDELYVHMGFHPAWKYEEVHELTFENGRLASERDCSAEMEEVRKRMGECLDPLHRPPDQ